MSESKQPESNDPNATTKDRLIADVKQMVADADALLQATSDQAGKQVAGLRARLQESLKLAQGRFVELETSLVDKTTESIREALQKTSEAANQAAEASKDAAQKAEEAARRAADSGKEAAQHASEAAQKTLAATRDAASKALAALKDWVR